MVTSEPGAMGPEAMDAAFNTVAAVNEGVCACAERANRVNRIVKPISDLRNFYSIPMNSV
jgi:hypothetical protein